MSKPSNMDQTRGLFTMYIQNVFDTDKNTRTEYHQGYLTTPCMPHSRQYPALYSFFLMAIHRCIHDNYSCVYVRGTRANFRCLRENLTDVLTCNSTRSHRVNLSDYELTRWQCDSGHGCFLAFSTFHANDAYSVHAYDVDHVHVSLASLENSWNGMVPLFEHPVQCASGV